MRFACAFPLVATMALGAAACAQSYRPIVDMQGVDEARYEADLAECRNYAQQVSPAGDAVSGGLVGGLIGAAVGSAVGAAVGNVASGAVVGGAAGGATGVAAGGSRGYSRQKTVINNCLSGRGYRVLG